MSILIKDMRMPENCIECMRSGLRTAIKCTEWTKISAGRRENERPWSCPLVDLGKHGDLIDRDALRAKFPEPKDMIDPQQALVHITGVWAEIDCADVVIEAEDSE